MFRQIFLLVAHRIDRAVHNPPQSQDKQFQKQHNEAHGHPDQKIFVLRLINEAELINSIGYGKLLLLVMPAIISPPSQRLKSQHIFPVARRRETRKGGQILQLSVILVKLYLCLGIKERVVALRRTPALGFQQHEVRVVRSDARVLVHLAERLLGY